MNTVTITVIVCLSICLLVSVAQSWAALGMLGRLFEEVKEQLERILQE